MNPIPDDVPPSYPPTTGACCFYDGHCEMFLELDCDHYVGEWLGLYTFCEPNPCPQPTQACCFDGGTCMDLTVSECEETGGSPMGAETNCGQVLCRAPVLGACCLIDTSCEIVGSQEDCSAIGGETWFNGEPCDPSPCFDAPAVEGTTWGQIKASYWE
jgi:hypothetical protein